MYIYMYTSIPFYTYMCIYVSVHVYVHAHSMGITKTPTHTQRHTSQMVYAILKSNIQQTSCACTHHSQTVKACTM